MLVRQSRLPAKLLEGFSFRRRRLFSLNKMRVEDVFCFRVDQISRIGKADDADSSKKAKSSADLSKNIKFMV
jgi:hypothetical protein